MRREPNAAERAAESMMAQVEAHEPERPLERWTCPCGQIMPGGVFFCEHPGGALSQDMRPRLKAR